MKCSKKKRRSGASVGRPSGLKGRDESEVRERERQEEACLNFCEAEGKVTALSVMLRKAVCLGSNAASSAYWGKFLNLSGPDFLIL